MEIIGTQQGLSPREKASLLKERLAYALRHPERVYRVSSRQATDSGLEYTDEAVDAAELLCALGRCSARQQRVLELWLGRGGRSQQDVARSLGLSVATVKREAAEALRRMALQVWDG